MAAENYEQWLDEVVMIRFKRRLINRASPFAEEAGVSVNKWIRDVVTVAIREAEATK